MVDKACYQLNKLLTKSVMGLKRSGLLKSAQDMLMYCSHSGSVRERVTRARAKPISSSLSNVKTRTVWSVEPLTICFPSGLKTTECTRLVLP